MSKEIICGIYKITNPSGKIYIGESQDISLRTYYYSIVSCHKQRKLYNSLKKHGWENHIFEIIEECEFDDLLCRERYWQDFYDVLGKNGLNLKLTSCGDIKGVVSQDTRDKISIKNKGAGNGMFGKTMSDCDKKARREYTHTKESLTKIQERSHRGNNPGAKLVLNLETGIFYGCTAEAAESINMKRDTLKQQLNGRRVNHTSFVYVDNFMSGINPKKEERFILDTETGIFYENMKEVSPFYNYSYLYLLKMLAPNSKVKNKTSLIYV